jgi:signal transduction histidine kinase
LADLGILFLSESLEIGAISSKVSPIQGISVNNPGPSGSPMKTIAQTFQLHPFRFLLYTEWVMLACCGTLGVLESFQKTHFPIQHFLVLFLLGGMGSILPWGKIWVKVLYTVIEFGLIYYGTTLGYLHVMPALYLIAVIRSCFIFESVGFWVVAGLAFAFHVKHQIQYLQQLDLRSLSAAQQQSLWTHQFGAVLTFGLALIFVVKLVRSLLSENKQRSQLAQANATLHGYALKIEALAAVQERNRIAREIHDSLGHVLTALNVQLQTAVRLWKTNPEQAEHFLNQSKQLGDTAMKEVRRSVGSLRQETKTEESLDVAIESLVKDFYHSTGIDLQTQILLDSSLPPSVVKTLYRIMQESLTNICKHAQATSVTIKLSEGLNWVYLFIEDNGKGFRLDSTPTGFGLLGMQERVKDLKGQFQIDSHPAEGCRIKVSLPLAEALA